MPDVRSLIRQGIRLPPGGWLLAAMLAFYVLAGLFGKDPWKGEDAIHIGASWHMLSTGDWLTPHLAGRPFHEPPLFYWTASLTGLLFGWLLPLHDAMRLASGIWVALTLTGLYYAGRELYGQESAAASPMLLAGTAGLLFHAHDAQPMLIALAAYAGTLGALAALGRKPELTGIFYGLALAGCVLGAGVAPALPLLLITPLACWLSPDRKKALITIGIGLGLATLLIAPWPLLLWTHAPARLALWWQTEMAPLRTPFSLGGLGRFSALLPWFAFPALPLAFWTVWRQRKALLQARFLLPLALFVMTLLFLAWTYRPREIPALLLLPAIALLATPGTLALRRGAANAFDWFAMSFFSVFAAVVWLCWSAMALGIPERLARRVVILRPGFVGQLDWLDLIIGIAATLCWLWLIVTAPRSPYRSLTHWTMGFTTVWLMATTLILPWFDFGKSYRPVAEAVAQVLPDPHDCLAERGLTDAQRASLAYFVGIQPKAEQGAEGKTCQWLLAVGSRTAQLVAPDSGWQEVWSGHRPGESQEKFRLYRR